MTKSTISNHAVRAGLAALATIALSSGAPVAADSPRQERVAYGDLDLTSDAGQTTLDKRIRAAVKRVCSPVGNSASEALEWSRCKRQSLAGANAQMEVAIARAGAGKTGIAAMTLGRSPTGKH